MPRVRFVSRALSMHGHRKTETRAENENEAARAGRLLAVWKTQVSRPPCFSSPKTMPIPLLA